MHIRGVVTYFDPGSEDIFLGDDASGIWIDWQRTHAKVQAGDLLDVVGVTSYGFAPDVSDAHWKTIGRAPMPVARPVTFEEMTSTAVDSRWVEVEGKVRQANSVRLADRGAISLDGFGHER